MDMYMDMYGRVYLLVQRLLRLGGLAVSALALALALAVRIGRGVDGALEGGVVLGKRVLVGGPRCWRRMRRRWLP